MDPSRSAYISCGTWGLVGVELEQPVVSRDGWKANFTNEVGADGRIRYLHNVMGLWLLSETVRQYQREGYRADLGELLAQAAEAPATVEIFDTDDARFLPPGDMPGRIRDWYDERGMRPPMTRAEMVRAIVESLAAAFADGVARAAELSGTTVETVHLVGGGSQNRLLCQLTADRLGLPGGRLSVGAPADLVLFDPDAPFVLDRFALRSKSKNTPFDGARMEGRVIGTWVGGQRVFGGDHD